MKARFKVSDVKVSDVKLSSVKPFRFQLTGVMGAILLLGAFARQTAFALSCQEPNLIRTLERGKASDKTYHVLIGTFNQLSQIQDVKGPNKTDNEIAPPKAGQLRARSLSRFRRGQSLKTAQAIFNGYSLEANHPDTALTDMPVNIELSCAGPWCGPLPAAGQSMIAFVEARVDAAPLLRVSPCGGNTFPAQPNGPKAQIVKKCLGETCDPYEADLVLKRKIRP